MSDKALVIVDVQKCFCPGGSLAVTDGDKVVPMLNGYIDAFVRHGLPVYATRDWHPEVTKHFKEFGGLWPPHCIQNTPEAEFHPDLKLPTNTEVISAGMGPEDEGYSGFDGINAEGGTLDESLRARGVKSLYVGGIATDYCVKETVLDALRLGFEAELLIDAVKGVNLKPDDSDRAVDQMKLAGARISTLEDVERELADS